MKSLRKIALLGFDAPQLLAGLREGAYARADEVVVLAPAAMAPEDADALLVDVGCAVETAWLSTSPRLRYVGVTGTDHGRVDVSGAARLGILTTHVPGYATEAVAEAVLEQVARRDGALGVLGLGRIGSLVARRASRELDVEVLGWSRRGSAQGGRSTTLDDVLRTCLRITTHLPRAAGMILDARLLALARPGVLLVHLSPLDLVDLDALAARLGTGDLTFVTDHADELDPALRTRLRELPGFVDLPPTASTSPAAIAARIAATMANLDAFLRGAPVNVVDAAGGAAETARRRIVPA